MVQILLGDALPHSVQFVFAGETEGLPQAVRAHFGAAFLSGLPVLSPQGCFTVYLGLGEKEALTTSRLMEGAAKAARQMEALGIAAFSMDVQPFYEMMDDEGIRAAVLGTRLGLYRFGGYGGTPEKTMRLTLTGVPSACAAVFQQAMALGDSVLYARDLVNTPANLLTPNQMAQSLKNEAEQAGATARILDEETLQALGMQALLSVGGGSVHPPCLCVLRWEGRPGAGDFTALVGKGVTYDTGGYCLKTAAGLKNMKSDMAGGAAAASALIALAKNKIPCNVLCVVPLCENRISSGSYVPGDVIGSMSGKTIEIINTDAEGRLILADAVTYAIRQEGAARIVDIATLTGAVVRALGHTTAGALCNDRPFWEELEEAAFQAGERYWRFPDYPEYRKLLDSKIATIKNVGDDQQAGTITAGLFVRAFAENRPWIHLDIAGTAWVDTPAWEYQTAGATGAGVTTLYTLMEQMGLSAMTE